MGLFGFGNREKTFWRWFERNSAMLLNFESDQQHAFSELARELNKVADGLTFEFGPPATHREFIISADGIVELFPAVERLVASAPMLPDWSVIAFRQPERSADSVEFGDLRLSQDDIWFRATPADLQFDLLLAVRGMTEQNYEQLAGAVFILLDALLGEYVAGTRISGIEWSSLPADPTSVGLRPFSELDSLLAHGSSASEPSAST